MLIYAESVPGSVNKEMAAIRQTLSKFGAYETLDGLKNELIQGGPRQRPLLPNISTMVADGTIRSCNGRRKVTLQSHHNPHHRYQTHKQQRRASRTATSLDAGSVNGQVYIGYSDMR